MKRLLYSLGLLILGNLSCGVKGPPEPPLPNEANIEKQILKESAKETQPAPVDKVSPTKEKTKVADPKKKTKDQ